MITLHTGDCLTVPWQSKRNAWICDPPANIAFMGRKWDKFLADQGFAPPIPPRSKAHLRELQSEFAFQRYWGERFRMMYDQSEDDAVAFVWALPRTAHLTQTALRWAGWRILDSWHHVFGQGFNKNRGHLKPAHEVWFVALKGKPKLNIDAGRVKRGGEPRAGHSGTQKTYSGGFASPYQPGDAAKHMRTDSSHPPNFALSHHPDCVRIGERKVKAANAVGGSDAHNVLYGKHDRKRVGSEYSTNGLESIPAYSCAVSCPCGRHWIEPSGGSPGMCECGRQGEWVCPVAELDEQSAMRGVHGAGHATPCVLHDVRRNGITHGAKRSATMRYGETNGSAASRFFPTFGYYAKASGRTDDEGVPRGERHAGCEELYWRANKDNPFGFDRVTREEWANGEKKATGRNPGADKVNKPHNMQYARGNVHPTVKGIEMMMYLAKLSGGTKIGDLCFGSGGTAIACQLLGLDFEGAELCPEAVEITNARLAFWSGFSLAALERFKLTRELPEVKPVDSRQQSLFGA